MADETLIVEVSLPLDRSRPVVAYTTDVPGLVVCPHATTHRVFDNQFTVTHQKSGWAIVGHQFYSIEVARMFAEEVRDFTDWTADPDQLQEALTAMGSREESQKKLINQAVAFEKYIEENPKVLLARDNLSLDDI